MQLVESQIDSLLPNAVDDDEAVESLLAKKEERIQARRNSQQASSFRSYRVTLPIVRASPQRPEQRTGVDQTSAVDGQEMSEEALASLVARGQEIALQNTVGMSLRQVYAGKRLSELALDVDTLRFQSFVDELQGRSVLDSEGKNGEQNRNLSGGLVQVLQNSALEMVKDSFDGVMVSSVAKGGLAWEAGVRAGDVLIATSATIGSVSKHCGIYYCCLFLPYTCSEIVPAANIIIFDFLETLAQEHIGRSTFCHIVSQGPIPHYGL